jgi:hypothetical protein
MRLYDLKSSSGHLRRYQSPRRCQGPGLPGKPAGNSEQGARREADEPGAVRGPRSEAEMQKIEGEAKM